MIVAVETIAIVLIFMLLFKDMSGKDELRRIRSELEKLNKREDIKEAREQATEEWNRSVNDG